MASSGSTDNSTEESTYSLTNHEDSEAGPDIAPLTEYDEAEFRPAPSVSDDLNAFDLEYLSKHGSTSQIKSHLARQSLYAKFDPLISSDGRPSILPPIPIICHNSQSTDRSRTTENVIEEESDLIAMDSPSPKKPSDNHVNHIENEPLFVAKQIAECHNEGKRPNSKSESLKDMFEESDLQDELKKRQLQIDDLKKVLEARLSLIDQLKIEAKQRKESEDQMKQVLKEYEKTISELISEKEREKGKFEEENSRLCLERDQAVEDLQNVETAFADVHRKYERTKQVVEGFKQNEVELKRCVEEHQLRMQKQDQKYELLKAHAEETLEKANKEIENLNRSQEAELARLSALLKKNRNENIQSRIVRRTKNERESRIICHL